MSAVPQGAVPQGHPDQVGWKPEGPAPFTPYIAPTTTLRELTARSVIVGTLPARRPVG